MRRLLVTLLLASVVAGCSNDADDEPDRDDAGAVAPAVRMAPAVPEARTEVGAARLGDRIVVLGGLRAEGTATDRVDVYDLATETWSEGPALPKALHHPGVTTFRGRIVVAGGYVTDGGQWLETAGVWSLGDDLDAGWREEPSLHTARGALGLAATGDRMLAFGGTAAGQVLTSVELFVTGADAWRTFPPLRQPREHLAATGAGGRIYAVGGRVGGLETNLASVESIDPNAFAPEWRDEPDLIEARGGIAAATIDRRPCVAGGEEPTGTIATVECLDGGRWRVVATLTEPRHGLGVVAGDDGRLHVLAGGPQPGLFVSTAHEVLTLAP
jgi:hypothetical protein